jgi:hypothetical protein
MALQESRSCMHRSVVIYAFYNYSLRKENRFTDEYTKSLIEKIKRWYKNSLETQVGILLMG